MIGNIVTDKDGIPVDGNGKKLATSAYQPSEAVKKLFTQVQADYQVGWMLQHHPFEEFDGISLLDRARVDQQTFAAYVGAEYQPMHKRWRWKGRKNTARNKLIGILAHMLAGMLFPYVHAFNQDNEEDKMAARVMKILVEDHLKKAGYEIKFLFLVTSALVNPAVICSIEYITAFQRVKEKLANGTYKVTEAIDELLSGIQINIIPIDEMLFPDYYSGTGEVQKLPWIIRVRRVSYDIARSEYAGKHFDENGKDLFDYVEAGKTRIVLAGQEQQTLFDIDWTEADGSFVQIITAYYRSEDLEVDFVGGVFFGNEEEIYNSNPFKHRRMSLIEEKWMSIPLYAVAMSGFEPLDPTGRFLWYKSGAFKEYWDALSEDRMYQIAQDGTFLDVFKPIFLSGVSKVDGTVIIPSATIPMPAGATMTPYSLGPNLSAALQMMNVNKENMSESTQDKIMTGQVEKGVTAYATQRAEQNARVFLGVFGVFVADLVKKLGEFVVDCNIQHVTVGEIDATIPEALKMKYKRLTAKGKDGGKNITNHIVFTDETMGQTLSQEEIKKREWDLFYKYGGQQSDQREYRVNPYKFARNKFSLTIDAEEIVSRSTGTYQQRKALAFQMLTDPRVAPYTDQETVANKLVIEEFSEGDPDQFKRKAGPQQDLLAAVMGNSQGDQSGRGAAVPSPLQANQITQNA